MQTQDSTLKFNLSHIDAVYEIKLLYIVIYIYIRMHARTHTTQTKQ